MAERRPQLLLPWIVILVMVVQNSPQTSLRDATKVVLGALSNIRKTPELRRNFVSGSNSSAIEAMDEVRNIFQPKIRKSAKKGKSNTITSTNEGKRKKKRKYFKHVIGDQIQFLIHLVKTGKTYMQSDWGNYGRGHVEASIPDCLTAIRISCPTCLHVSGIAF